MKLAAVVLIAGCVDGSLSTTEQATTVCAQSAASVHGIDVSSYETSIDWTQAKAAGIDFAFIRVSDGLQYHDPKFATFWTGAAAAGVMRGAYQFFRPEQDPIAQADYLLAQIGPRGPLDLPPAIDVEVTDGMAPEDVAAAVRVWVDHVTAAIGRPPIIYAGYYSWQDYTGNANLTSSPLWHAQYTSAACPNIPTPWTRWAFWQYSSTGQVPGVLGEASDLDVFDGSLSDLQAFAAGAPATCGVIGADGGTIDNTDACFAAGGPASTLRQVTDAGEGGSLVWTKSTAADLPGNFAQWTIAIADAGHYTLEAYTAAPYAQSTQATYRVRAAGSETEATIDQSASDGWQPIGQFAFAAGGDQFVELSDNTGEAGKQLVFDAIRLTRTDRAQPLPDPTPTVTPDDDDGGCATTHGAGWLLALLALTLRRGRSASRRAAWCRTGASP